MKLKAPEKVGYNDTDTKPVPVVHLRKDGIEDASEEVKEESWRHLLLNQEVVVRSVHQCTLVKFKTAGEDVVKNKVYKSADNKPSEELAASVNS